MTVADVPVVAVVKRLLDPLVIIGLLWIIAMANDESFSGAYLVLAVLTFFISAQVYDEMNLYESWGRRRLARHARTLFGGWVIVAGMLSLLGFATGMHVLFNVSVFLAWAVTCPFVLLLTHYIMRRLMSGAMRERQMRTVVIAGINDVALKLSQKITDNPYLFMDVHGYFDDRARERLPEKLPGPLLGNLRQLVGYVRRKNTNIIFVCLPMSAQPRIVKLMDELRDTTASVYFVPDIYVFDLIHARFDNIQGIPIVAVRETPLLGIESVMKRLSDIVLSGILLLLAMPLMLVIAIAVKADSPGPVVFKQRRYGLNGEEINIYKFRTMTVCENGNEITQAKKEDARVTAVGRFLRRTSLDELPQLINVLQGRMSLVGPRPHAVAHNELYRKLIKGYMLRHKVRPGLTGWAQVNGLRGETDMVELMQRRVDFDLDYLRNWSLSLDLWILVRTVWIVIKGENAH